MCECAYAKGARAGSLVTRIEDFKIMVGCLHSLPAFLSSRNLLKEKTKDHIFHDQLNKCYHMKISYESTWMKTTYFFQVHVTLTGLSMFSTANWQI